MNELTTLDTLADQINRNHEEAQAYARQALIRALEAGHLLIEAKAQVKHGEWAGWCTANLSFAARTARMYMQLATHRERLESAGVADLTVSDAVKLISAPRSVEPVEGGYLSGKSPEKLSRAFCRTDSQYKDVMSYHQEGLICFASILAEDGASADEIAKRFGLTVEEINTALAFLPSEQMQAAIMEDAFKHAMWAELSPAEAAQDAADVIRRVSGWYRFLCNQMAEHNAPLEGYPHLANVFRERRRAAEMGLFGSANA